MMWRKTNVSVAPIVNSLYAMARLVSLSPFFVVSRVPGNDTVAWRPARLASTSPRGVTKDLPVSDNGVGAVCAHGAVYPHLDTPGVYKQNNPGSHSWGRPSHPSLAQIRGGAEQECIKHLNVFSVVSAFRSREHVLSMTVLLHRSVSSKHVTYMLYRSGDYSPNPGCRVRRIRVQQVTTWSACARTMHSYRSGEYEHVREIRAVQATNSEQSKDPSDPTNDQGVQGYLQHKRTTGHERRGTTYDLPNDSKTANEADRCLKLFPIQLRSPTVHPSSIFT